MSTRKPILGFKFIKVSQKFDEPLVDVKINGRSWMVKMNVEDYLTMVNIEGNKYQRNLQNLTFYRKLIEDLLNDTTMPPISVVYPEKDIDFTQGLRIVNKFIILDGLQRTNCLLECRRIIDNGKSTGKYKTIEEFNKKLIYVEIWEKLELPNILYKMVVLNTGQKKMDYEHQLDILSDSVKTKLNEMGVKYYVKNDKLKTIVKKGKFELSTVTAALVSYINRSPIPGKKNAAEFLFNRFDISVEANEAENALNLINDEETYFHLKWVLVDLNKMLNEKYGVDQNPINKYDVFLISLFASLGFCHSKKPELLKAKINLLEEMFKSHDDDPLRMNKFDVIYTSFTSGIGDKRRRFIFNSLKIFFLTPIVDDTFDWNEEYAQI